MWDAPHLGGPQLKRDRTECHVVPMAVELAVEVDGSQVGGAVSCGGADLPVVLTCCFPFY